MKAQEQRVARLTKSYNELLSQAMSIIERSRNLAQTMISSGLIAAALEA